LRNSYSLYEAYHNVISYIYTKLFFSKARLIRLPVFIRNKKYLDYSSGLTTGYNCRIEMFNSSSSNSKTLFLGKNLKMGDYVHIAAGESVIIGDDCLFASKIFISDISHGLYSGQNQTNPSIAPDNRELFTKAVKIGNKVWLGESVSILPGVTIGNGAIIGANSIVNKNIPDYSIAVGNPAKVIKKFDFSTNKWIRIVEETAL